MVLSFYMLSMYMVGMYLKSQGKHWFKQPMAWYNLFQIYDCLQDWIFYPPQHAKQRKTRCQQLLLAALVVASQKADAALPEFQFLLGMQANKEVQDALGPRGILLTTKLSLKAKQLICKAVHTIPSYLFHPGNSEYAIINSGASVTATGNIKDFKPDNVTALDVPMPMDGIAGSLKGTHKGTLWYKTISDDGSVVVLECEGYYVLELPFVLFSPQDYFIQREKQGIFNEQMRLNGCKMVLDLNSHEVTVSHNNPMQLPKLQLYCNSIESAENLAMTCITDKHNQNLTHLQKLLLQWHWQLGHLGFQ